MRAVDQISISFIKSLLCSSSLPHLRVAQKTRLHPTVYLALTKKWVVRVLFTASTGKRCHLIAGDKSENSIHRLCGQRAPTVVGGGDWKLEVYSLVLLGGCLLVTGGGRGEKVENSSVHSVPVGVDGTHDVFVAFVLKTERRK